MRKKNVWVCEGCEVNPCCLKYTQQDYVKGGIEVAMPSRCPFREEETNCNWVEVCEHCGCSGECDK